MLCCLALSFLTSLEWGKRSEAPQMNSFHMPKRKKTMFRDVFKTCMIVIFLIVTQWLPLLEHLQTSKNKISLSVTCTSCLMLTFIMVMAMYRASFTIMGSYVASSLGTGSPPNVRSGPEDEGEELPGSRCSFFTFSGCIDFFCETGTAFTSTWDQTRLGEVEIVVLKLWERFKKKPCRPSCWGRAPHPRTGLWSVQPQWPATRSGCHLYSGSEMSSGGLRRSPAAATCTQHTQLLLWTITVKITICRG